MKKNSFFALAAGLLLSFSACDSSKTSNQDNSAASTTDSTAMDHSAMGSDSVKHEGTMGPVMEKNGLKVYSYGNSVDFPDAKLSLNKPEKDAKVPADSVKFEYEVKDFELSKQTSDAATHEHANSAQGQHIHNIVDNQPYTAHYKPVFNKDIKAGNHVVLSFLSRSYHESIKHKSAYDLRVITVGNTSLKNDFNTDGEHMFYSRPKGEYVGADTKKVMLDFYLVNTELAKDGNKVRATINGTEFMLDQWLPYLIEGLPMGETTIKLELLDKDGKIIPGPYNTVERKITLKAS